MEGSAKGMLVLGVLWWCWVGYAGDERRRSRGGDRPAGHLRRDGGPAGGGAVRAGRVRRHRPAVRPARRAWSAPRTSRCSCSRSRDDPALRSRARGWPPARRWAPACWSSPRSPTGPRRAPLWALALELDMGGPLLSARRLAADARATSPSATADRRSSRWASRSSRSASAPARRVAPASSGGRLGIAVAAALWWLYFDVVALVAARAARQRGAGQEQNGIARDRSRSCTCR